MPLYTYRCEAGHTFERVGKMDGSDAPTECGRDMTRDNGIAFGGNSRVTCASPVQKVIAAPARTFPGADSWRR
jgi:predicted nucleic acid-binding Zn ribbon protein